MLLYVYCVVPFSLCRNGGSGLRGQNSTNGGLSIPTGFRLDWAGTGGEQNPPAPPQKKLDASEHRSKSVYVLTESFIVVMSSFQL